MITEMSTASEAMQMKIACIDSGDYWIAFCEHIRLLALLPKYWWISPFSP